MTAIILNGKALAGKIKKGLAHKVDLLKQKTGQVPGLAYFLVDDDPVSAHYVAGKARACREVGINSFVIPFASTLPEGVLLNRIEEFNLRPDVHGIIVQLPLPPQMAVRRVVDAINPNKDADGFHPLNRGLLFSSNPPIAPCTPKGIVLLLKENGIQISGKHVVILGRSLVVGRPLAMLMLGEDATVTVAHQKTNNLLELTRSAEILVAAIGRPGFITDQYVSRGTVVVDVGINPIKGKLVGDVNFEEVSLLASYITPVPGGVGPMTVAMLLENTVLLFERQLMLSRERDFRGQSEK